MTNRELGTMTMAVTKYRCTPERRHTPTASARQSGAVSGTNIAAEDPGSSTGCAAHRLCGCGPATPPLCASASSSVRGVTCAMCLAAARMPGTGWDALGITRGVASAALLWSGPRHPEGAGGWGACPRSPGRCWALHPRLPDPKHSALCAAPAPRHRGCPHVTTSRSSPSLLFQTHDGRCDEP